MIILVELFKKFVMILLNLIFGCVFKDEEFVSLFGLGLRKSGDDKKLLFNK